MNENTTYNGLTEAVQSLPSTWYYETSQFEKELDQIWSRNWIYVCPEHSLRSPHSFRTLKVGAHNIVVLRDRQNELKAFHNTCRHRGTELCNEHEGTLKSNSLVCPYHQWSFSATTGELQGVTSHNLPEDFDKSDYGLFEVGLNCWQGLVFINLDSGHCWSDDSTFQYKENIVGDVPVNELVHGFTWRKTVKCNWKIYWENYSECLHCPNVHPELAELVPIYTRRINQVRDAHDWEKHQDTNDPKYIGGLKPGAETWSMDGSAQGHSMESIENHDDLFKGFSYSVSWPSMYVGVYRDHIRTVRLMPIDSETTELTADWLFEKSALDDPEFKKEHVTDFEILVMEQDAKISELNQRGLRSPAFERGVLMPEEHGIKDFQDWYRREMYG